MNESKIRNYSISEVIGRFHVHTVRSCINTPPDIFILLPLYFYSNSR